MDTVEFWGQKWKPHPTSQDKYSFFHAVFGHTERAKPFRDKDVKFRLECLQNFYSFRDNTDRMLDSISSEDIPIIATLENVKITIYNVDNNTVQVVEPWDSVLGDYPLENRNSLKEVIVAVRKDRFMRLNLASAVQEEHVNLQYNKLPGSAGIKGGLYQVNLLTIFLLNGLKTTFDWLLSTENCNTGKFDDLVFQMLPDKTTILLQAKHKKDRNDKISYDSLLTANSKKDDFSLPKYFFSYHEIKKKLKVKQVYLCTNVDIQFDKVKEFVETRSNLPRDNMLYYNEVDCTCYTFKTSILPENKLVSYFETNLKTKNSNRKVITNENVKEFLDHFLFIANYPDRGDLDAVVEKMIAHTDFPFNMKNKDCSKYVIKKMIEWFEDTKGVYHTKATARALFSEIVSNKLCEKLQNCGVTFKVVPSVLNKGVVISHIVPHKGFILNMIKVFLALQETSERFLFVNPFEDVQTQKRVIEAFWMPRYTVLVVCLKNVPDNILREFGECLMAILQKRNYKRVILIARDNNVLGELLKGNKGHQYMKVQENITFSDMTEDSQIRMLEKVIQLFHKAI